MPILSGKCEITFTPEPRCMTHNEPLVKQIMYDHSGAKWYHHYCPVEGSARLATYNEKGSI